MQTRRRTPTSTPRLGDSPREPSRICGPATGGVFSTMTRQSADDELWAAVADPSRRRVLDLIVGHGEVTPTALASELPFTRQAVGEALGRARAGRPHRRPSPWSGGPLTSSAPTASPPPRTRWHAQPPNGTKRLEAIKRLAESTQLGEIPPTGPEPS